MKKAKLSELAMDANDDPVALKYQLFIEENIVEHED